jgi:hypothetical protein
MNYKIELTKEELTTILQVATGNVKDFVMDNDKFINEQLEAINYTHCCTELKDKEAMTWGEWKKAFIVEEKNGRFWHADGGRWSFEEISWKYNDYKKNL